MVRYELTLWPKHTEPTYTIFNYLCYDYHTQLLPGDFIHTLGDAHVYNNHVIPLREQLAREPRPFPKLNFKRKVENIDDFRMEDFELVGYRPHPKISMEMSV